MRKILKRQVIFGEKIRKIGISNLEADGYCQPNSEGRHNDELAKYILELTKFNVFNEKRHIREPLSTVDARERERERKITY